MTYLSIKQSGMMATIQDSGRRGLLKDGVSGSGAIDPYAFQIAQALVGNDCDSAAIEFAHIGGKYQTSAPTRIAITGGAGDFKIDGQTIYAWQSYWLHPGQTLAIGAMRNAVWGYIAFSGGLAVEPVMGSRATHARTGIGGLDGRQLVAGDQIPLGHASDAPCRKIASARTRMKSTIRVVLGPDIDYFSEKILTLFQTETFSTSMKRDRMACLLDGPLLPAAKGHDLISESVLPGTIQVPGSGQPMVLGVDCQTTGGYPKIATVISADLPRLMQLPAGQPFHFAAISQDEAEDLMLADRQALKSALANLQIKPQ